MAKKFSLPMPNTHVSVFGNIASTTMHAYMRRDACLKKFRVPGGLDCYTSLCYLALYLVALTQPELISLQVYCLINAKWGHT